MEITIHTGEQSARNTIHIAWFDENNVRCTTTIEANIQEQDKPRQLEIKINDQTVAILGKSTQETARRRLTAADFDKNIWGPEERRWIATRKNRE